MATSPGINIIERDSTAYPTTSGSTMLAVVGYASKGPKNLPTLISSKTQFIETFGNPCTLSPYSGIASLRALDKTDRLLFTRISDTTDSASECLVMPSLYATASFTNAASITLDADATQDPGGGTYLPSESTGLTIAVATTFVSDLLITTPASGNWTAIAIFESLKAALAYNPVLYKKVKIELIAGKIVFTALNPLDTLSVINKVGLDNNLVLSLGSVAIVPALAGNSAGTRLFIKVTSKETGSSGNLVSLVKSSRKSPTDAYTLVHKIDVYLNGKLKETYDNLVMTYVKSVAGSFMKVINDASELISLDVSATPPTVFPDGTYVLGAANYGSAYDYSDTAEPTLYTYKVGTDGIADTDGDRTAVAVAMVTAFSLEGDLANSELYDYHVLITPDTYQEVVQDAAISLAESRKDFMYLVDPPIGITYKNVIDWHNGSFSTTGKARSNRLVSSYAAVYAPWVKVTNPVSGEATWVPPSVVLAEKLLDVDRLYGSWAAPAGDTRGVLTGVSDYEYSPSKAQRDELYGDPNVVNPIVYFNTKGIEVYGEKTCLREEGKAMSRIHVRRLVIYITKLLKKTLDGFIYESNSPAVWSRAAERLNSILDRVRNAGGLSNYQVVIDSTNNTAESTIQNKMNVIVRLVPFGVIETIEVNLSVDMTGTTIV